MLTPFFLHGPLARIGLHVSRGIVEVGLLVLQENADTLLLGNLELLERNTRHVLHRLSGILRSVTAGFTLSFGGPLLGLGCRSFHLMR